MSLAYVELLFEQYGYGCLFVGMILEFIGLPVPGETMMTFAGYLSYRGALHWFPPMGLAFAGTTIGVTLTYWIGYKTGLPFIRRYGKWVLLTEHRIEKTQRWFDRYGNKLLFIGYFIPGVRHLIGYFSGIVRTPFRVFALYAYAGACFWVICFICLGKLFGPHWQSVFVVIERDTWKAIAVAGGAIVLYVLARRCIRAGKKTGARKRIPSPDKRTRP